MEAYKKLITLFSIHVFCVCAAPSCVLSQDEYVDPAHVQDKSAASGKQRGNAQAFFETGKGNQNFFSGRNLSNQSMFSSEVSNSVEIQNQLQQSSTQDVPAPAAQEPSDKESFDARVAPHSREQEGHVESTEDQAQTQAVIDQAQRGDADMQDILEHSRKIRQAIFGEQAEQMLPKAVRDGLRANEPKQKIQDTRF